ncbi:hypothetical protein J3459_006664 [Metarhizium acridum]|nr:hypothetical protein J3459_006664 [Metarhizium acridum]
MENTLSDILLEKIAFHTEVNLGQAEAHAELPKYLEQQLDLVGEGNRGLVPLKITILDHIFIESKELRRIRYFLRYIEHLPFPTEAAVKETVHQFSTDNSAFSTILQLVPPSSQSLVKDAICWILHSMRPLTCDELGVALRTLEGDDNGDSQMKDRSSPNVAEALDNMLCGVVEIDNNTIYHTSISGNFSTNPSLKYPGAEWATMLILISLGVA